MADHVEIWVQPPPLAPVEKPDIIAHSPPLDPAGEVKVSEDLMLLGMMLWMEQGLALEWLQPRSERKDEEEETEQARRRGEAL